MPENNQVLSVEGQLVGMPLAGPESFSQQQLDYLKRALGVDETVLWSGVLYQVGDTYTQNLSETVRNFSKIQFWVRRRFAAPSAGRCYFTPTVVLTFESTNNALAYINAVDIAGGAYAQNCIYVQFPTDTTVKLLAGTKFAGGTYSNNLQTYEFSIEKIVGIGRIAGGN